MTGRVDLLLGGDLGLWALSRVSPAHVGRVVTLDKEIAAAATTAGLRAELGHLDALGSSGARTAFSVHYPRLISAATLGRYEAAVNLHPGLLPWGRGWYPAFWALWEGSPAGASLHHMQAGVDEGPIIDQIEVTYDDADTGGSLHTRVRNAERALLERYWPAIASGADLPSHPQPAGGTFHSREEFLGLKRAAPWHEWDAARLLRLARCLSFPGHPGAEVNLGGAAFSLELRTLDE